MSTAKTRSSAAGHQNTKHLLGAILTETPDDILLGMLAGLASGVSTQYIGD